MIVEDGPPPTGHDHDWHRRANVHTRDIVDVCTRCGATRSHRHAHPGLLD